MTDTQAQTLIIGKQLQISDLILIADPDHIELKRRRRKTKLLKHGPIISRRLRVKLTATPHKTNEAAVTWQSAAEVKGQRFVKGKHQKGF